MPGHSLAPSTRTVELLQLMEINDRLAEATRAVGSADAAAVSPAVPLTADTLGLTGAPVRPRVVDRTALLVLPRQERRSETLVLPPDAPLRSLLAAGDPEWPYFYGIFDELAGRRRLPVQVGAGHLRTISAALGLNRHHWDD
jgi:hypothetical protein